MMKKIKLILSILVIIVVVIVLIYFLKQSISSKKITTEPPLSSNNGNSLVNIHLKTSPYFEILYKTANNPTEKYDINVLVNGSEAEKIINELEDIQFSKLEGLFFANDDFDYIINFSNGAKFICAGKNSNIVLYQNGEEKIFIEIPRETMQKLSKYVFDELNKKQLLYETEAIILTNHNKKVTLTSKKLINIILQECRENFQINEKIEKNNVKYILNFKDNVILNIFEDKFEDKNVAELLNGTKKSYVYVSDNLIEMLNNIATNEEKNLLNILNTNEVIIKKDNKETKIKEKADIQDIVQMLISLRINYDTKEKNLNSNEKLTEIVFNDNVRLSMFIHKNMSAFNGDLTINNNTYTIKLNDNFISYIENYVKNL